MLVRQILVMKDGAGGVGGTPGEAGVVTIPPDRTVAEATTLMAQRRIGALVVSQDGTRPIGILSERDIVRELGTRGAAVLDATVVSVMTAKIATCATGDDAHTVLERMTEGRFRHLPVLDEDGRLLGLVSIGDAVSSRLKELHDDKEALTGMIMGT